ncbi:MAG: transcriptional regulator NrdR [Chloroflexota bacterium]|nr:transcriptional regulator NrdR [Chloroflexota bacterium]
MRCPKCAEPDTRVIDSRDLEAGSTIRRRRECPACTNRFTTYERAEGARLAVIKRDGTHEDFDRAKVQSGLMRALEKRPVTIAQVEQAVDEIEAELRTRSGNEVTSREIGKLATEKLRDMDQLAYIRFASVYHSYEDISTLKREVDRLMER